MSRRDLSSLWRAQGAPTPGLVPGQAQPIAIVHPMGTPGEPVAVVPPSGPPLDARRSNPLAPPCLATRPEPPVPARQSLASRLRYDPGGLAGKPAEIAPPGHPPGADPSNLWGNAREGSDAHHRPS